MTMLMIVAGLVGASGIVAVVRQKRNARRNEGPIQLGVGTKIRP